MQSHLKNQESLVIKVDTTSFEQSRDLAVVGRATVDRVLARVVAVSGSGHDQLGVGHDLELIATSRLQK